MELLINGLKRSYGSKTVLDIEKGLISSGKITGVIGPNGAGKSTLLNIIAGLDKPSEGSITYQYLDQQHVGVSTEATPYQMVTLLFQQPYLIHTTVEGNIAYPLKLRKWSESDIRARVDELMKDLGLTEFAQQKTWRLSGGEKQKVAFARALSFRPDLLLLDEPTSNVDNATIAEIETMLSRARDEQGMTIVIVNHNLPQIKRLCDEVMFLHHGNLVEYGATSKLLVDPDSPETRAFVAGELLL